MILIAPQKKKIFGPNLNLKLLKNSLSIRVRNFAPINAPLNIFSKKVDSVLIVVCCIGRQWPHQRVLCTR
jgi:hypothetical protein